MAEIVLNGIAYPSHRHVHREEGDIPTHRMLRLVRTLTGLTKVAAAEAIGVCAGTLAAWETGRPLPFDAAVKLCRLYGISVEVLAVTVDNDGWGDFHG